MKSYAAGMRLAKHIIENPSSHGQKADMNSLLSNNNIIQTMKDFGAERYDLYSRDQFIAGAMYYMNTENKSEN